MKIKNIEGLSTNQLNLELASGGRFVVFQYTISIIIMTFRRSSDIYFIRSGEGAWKQGLKYSLLTFFLGWWGFPWGPIYSIGSLFKNSTGGQDVTQEVLAAVQKPSYT